MRCLRQKDWLKPNRLAAFLLVVLPACSTFLKPHPAPVAGVVTTTSNSPFEKHQDHLQVYHSASNDDDDDDEDLEGGNDETPTDLGDLDVSQKRKAEEVTADSLAAKTFPLVHNEFVEQWIKYFTGRGYNVFERWIQRSTRYIPAMRAVLREEGLPEDLIYLAMIESGFNPKAASRAKAVGPWQFIKGTGQRYGLAVDYWVDERRDFIKSTRAAAVYLKELHQVFGSWYLAAAAYNAGEGKVLNAVRTDRSRNFWELCRAKKNFRSETRNYVPKIIAAALVSKNPEKYGFKNLDFEEPLVWTDVPVPPSVDLRSVADLIKMDSEELLILNSELRRGITPPNGQDFAIRIPPAKKDAFLASASELKSKKFNRNFVLHVVRRGDSLAKIARRYGSDSQSILELNHLKSAKRLKPGTELSIPVAMGDGSPRRGRHSRRHARDEQTNEESVSTPGLNKVAHAGPAGATKGDSTMPATPGQEAGKIVQSPATLPKSEAAGGVGNSLAATASPTMSRVPGAYTLRSGDTLWDLAKKYGVTVQQLKRANNLRSARDLRPGKTLVIPN